MKMIYLVTAALLFSTAAQAGGMGNSVSFEIEGQKVRIDVPKHCDSLNCIQITAPGLSKSGFNLKGLNFGKSSDDDDDTADAAPAAKTVPAPAPAPSAPAPTAAPPMHAAVPAPAVTVPASPTVASTTAPAVHDVVPANLPPPPAPAALPAPQSAPAVAAPVAANTPVGIWKTEDDKGNVRIEQCGADLCGYAVGSGEKILINMRREDSKWVGRIHDPDSGRNYDSSIAMKGSNILRVQGCAFGGLFCGGQTWKRVS